MIVNNSRNKELDILKSIAIILVVLGHCIQYGSGNQYLEEESFLNNILFKIIYSFHMPLFMLISGYLFYSSAQKYTTRELLKKKVVTILIPLLSFSIIDLTINILFKRTITFNIIFQTFFGKLWFLWAIIILSFITTFIKKFFKDNIIIYLILFILTFFVPTKFNIQLYAFLYPYFIIGYFSYKYKNIFIKNININIKYILNLIIFIFFIILLCFYNYHSYIYTSGMSIINNISQIFIDLYRLIIGIIGSTLVIITVINLCDKVRINKSNYILDIGRNTLGIYAISNFLFIIMKKITYNFDGINYIYLIIEGFIVIMVCMLIIKIIRKNRILAKLLLGIST